MIRPATERQSFWLLVCWLSLALAWAIFGRGVLFIIDTIANGAAHV